eukprot:gene11167-17171_t
MDELSDDGAFKRTASIWRKWIKKGSDEYPPEKNRYHLYVSYACPWASRCLAVRALKGLENVVSVSVVHPTLLRSRPDDENDQHIGWWFCDGEKQEPVANILGHGSIPAEGATVDHVNGKKFVRDIYEMCKDTHGKSTVPILFDKKTNMIVNNESADIVEMFDKEFQGIGENPDTSIELFPSGRERELEEINSQVYEINDGVYRCGFSTTQQAYNTAVDALYKNLDWAEERLSHSRETANGEEDKLMNLRNGSSASARYHPYRCHPHVVSVPSEKSISYTIAKRAENQEDKRWDLVTNDGKVTSMDRTTNRRTMTCQVTIDNISPRFAGWDPSFHVYFNLKSTLSQLGINGVGDDIVFRPTEGKATVRVTLTAVTPIGILMLDEIGGGTELGKLFCREPKRRVADPNYLKSLVGRVDMQGRPVLNLGEEGIDWWSEMGDGRAIFHIRLRHGCVGYGGQVHGFLPTVGLALRKGKPCKKLLKLHQTFHHDRSRLAVPNQMLM